MTDYDLAIIGGGLNGVSVARDAAGRGLRVILFEQGDLGAAASSATSRIIGGDLAVLERRAFFRGRLASSSNLPASVTVDVTHHPVGNALKRPFGTAFEYSNCLVDDSRLVIANALDATERGADIRTGARCVRADRFDTWRLAVIDRGHRQGITARALANAAGAWTASVAETVLRMPLPRTAVTQISQIVVRRLFDTDNVYVFRNSDRRLIFASPYQRDFTLIGTVAKPFKGDPAVVSMTAHDVAYLCDAANRYFREHIDPSDVIRTVSGVNTVMGPAGTRLAGDGRMVFDAGRGKAPLLTIFGGEVTTSRRRAEGGGSRLPPFYPMSPRWTAGVPLPGGDFAWERFDAQVDLARQRWRFLGEDHARRLVEAYGSRLAAVLGDAREKADLGPAFGPELTGAEVRYLIAKEWARFPDDILWRRSKLGLTVPPADREALAAFMATSA